MLKLIVLALMCMQPGEGQMHKRKMGDFLTTSSRRPGATYCAPGVLWPAGPDEVCPEEPVAGCAKQSAAALSGLTPELPGDPLHVCTVFTK